MLQLAVPARIWELLEKAEQVSGLRKEDLIMRAVVKVCEEFGVKP